MQHNSRYKELLHLRITPTITVLLILYAPTILILYDNFIKWQFCFLHSNLLCALLVFYSNFNTKTFVIYIFLQIEMYKFLRI